MENEDKQFENLENLTNEELEAKVEEAEAENNDANDNSNQTDWESKAAAAEKRAAMLQRLLNKKDKTINKTTTNNQPDYSKDIAEIKLARKIDSFSEENGLTRVQAEKILSLYPNATAETLKDPFIAEGIKAIARKERVDNATPNSSRGAVINGKTFRDMTRDERIANFSKVMGN